MVRALGTPTFSHRQLSVAEQQSIRAVARRCQGSWRLLRMVCQPRGGPGARRPAGPESGPVEGDIRHNDVADSRRILRREL